MAPESMETVKRRMAEEVAALHPRLIEMSHEIHADPEIMFQEHRASALLAGELEKAGFAVQRGVAGLETAFVATYGQGKPVLAFLGEYDALPKIGHGCGHNLIGVWAVGAGIALKRAMPDLKGTIRVVGCPGEEGGGGKAIMAEAGVFRGVDAAIMAHPRDTTYLNRGSLGLARYAVEFFGKSAHASSYPERGINALDAVLQVFHSVNAMRQQMRMRARIHGVITDGGIAPNIIPDHAACEFLVRAPEQDYLEELKGKFLKIVDAAALATGARSRVTEGISYMVRTCNEGLIETLRENVEALGIPYEIPPADDGVGSSDVGHVSRLVPVIHPYLAVCDKGAANHSIEFAEIAVGKRADEMLATGATLLAWTGADVLLRPEVRERVRATFREQLGRDPQE